MRGRVDLVVAAGALGVLVCLTVWVVLGQPVGDDSVLALRSTNPTLGAVTDTLLTVVSPPVDILALLGFGVYRSYRRLDGRPLLVAGGAALALGITVLGMKHAIARPFPLPPLPPLAFPSGHTASALVCSGTVVLLSARRSPAAWSAVGVLTTLVAVALLLRAAHWASDVVGALALGVVLLVGVARATREERLAPGR